jgi:phosphonatase-like hydrolase
VLTVDGVDLMDELKLVVFDMAGTTVRDKGQVISAFTAALAEHHLEVTAEQLSNVRGASKRQAVLHLIPAGPERARRAEQVYESFCEHLAQRYRTDGIEPIAGAEQVFQWLRAQGVRVALNTGFERDITDLLLTVLNWKTDLVDAVICGDAVQQGRPAPYLIFHAMEATGTTNVQQVANVGDTILDLKAGHNAGVRWNIGVLSGAHNRQQLEQAPHTHLLPSIAALPELFSAVSRLA